MSSINRNGISYKSRLQSYIIRLRMYITLNNDAENVKLNNNNYCCLNLHFNPTSLYQNSDCTFSV